jgi:hypothetical protein
MSHSDDNRQFKQACLAIAIALFRPLVWTTEIQSRYGFRNCNGAFYPNGLFSGAIDYKCNFAIFSQIYQNLLKK